MELWLNKKLYAIVFLSRVSIIQLRRARYCCRNSPRVCLYDCPTHVDIVLERVNILSSTERHMVAWELYVKFYRTRDLLQFPRATPRYGK